ncbi:MAG TPA: ribonuclease domain-containing protein [Burkholderiaceae bacterium]|nr:ribonuclease domain-containing protein [Burkholderiaceae bacterium]
MNRYLKPWAVLRLVLALGMFALVGIVQARDVPATTQAVITYAELPREAQRTLALIRLGGPFPYSRKDGSVFSNRERLLPRKPRGYYREYTVPTPGSRDRGARRIVAGAGLQNDVRQSGEYWYTDDHYASFRRIIDWQAALTESRP